MFTWIAYTLTSFYMTFQHFFFYLNIFSYCHLSSSKFVFILTQYFTINAQKSRNNVMKARNSSKPRPFRSSGGIYLSWIKTSFYGFWVNSHVDKTCQKCLNSSLLLLLLKKCFERNKKERSIIGIWIPNCFEKYFLILLRFLYLWNILP